MCLANTLGSIMSLTDSTGSIVEAYRYSVYGQVDDAGTMGNPYLFTGREFDSETGLYYYRARYYSAGLRRFLQPDPIGYAVGMNSYEYVGNSPVGFVDPRGLWAEAKAIEILTKYEGGSGLYRKAQRYGYSLINTSEPDPGAVRDLKEIYIPSYFSDKQAALYLAHEFIHLTDSEDHPVKTDQEKLNREYRAWMSQIRWHEDFLKNNPNDSDSVMDWIIKKLNKSIPLCEIIIKDYNLKGNEISCSSAVRSYRESRIQYYIESYFEN